MQESLTNSTSRALGWSYLGSIVRLFLTFGVNVLLTRLLGPRPFGLMAVAMLLFSLGNLLSGIGVTSALIQKQKIEEHDVLSCFTAQMILGCAVFVLLSLSAPVWSSFFREPELASVLRAFSPLFLFQSFGATPTALLNREQNTRGIQVASILSYTSAFLGLGVPLAFLGYGIWSLVIAYLAQSFLNSMLVYAQVRHSLIPRFHRRSHGVTGLGLSALGANLCNWGISNLDNTFVGKEAGPIALGFYSRAFTLASLPAESIIGNLQQALLPSFSRVQTQTDRIRRAYLAAVSVVALVLLPPFCAMAVVPRTVVLGLYGNQWAGAASLFQPLALAIPLNAVMALSGPLLAARERPHREMRLQFAVLLVASCSFWFSLHRSLQCMSWTVLLVYLVRFVFLTQAAIKEIGARWRDIGRAVMPGVALANVAVIAALLLNLVLPSTPVWIRLAAVAAGSLLVTLMALITGRKILFRPILENMPQLEHSFRVRFLHFRSFALVEESL